ncbi:MAG: glycosidase [Candidatus Marinimicrobia bacterium]|nr:glycosidase [Candidatus Neomarinimicrobiota bacterium]
MESRNRIGPLGGLAAIRRHPGNPIFSAADVPYPSTLAMNAGVTKYRGRYVMAFRNDVCRPDDFQRLVGTGTGMAFSEDGVHFTAAPEPMKFHYKGTVLERCNDTRLTVIDDTLYLSFCFNGFHSERPGIAIYRDACNCEVISLGVPAQRNLILAPDRINGRYWRLERPYPRCRKTIGDIWISYSQDLRYWGDAELLLAVEDVPFANLKIGGAAPPLKTERGFLMTFHAVDNDPDRVTRYPTVQREWTSRYTLGAALLDLNDPQQVIGITPTPLMVPQETYETGDPAKFFREDVIFPVGLVREDHGLLRIYYGAGDLWQCLAEIEEDTLLEAIQPCRRQARFANLTKDQVGP